MCVYRSTMPRGTASCPAAGLLRLSFKGGINLRPAPFAVSRLSWLPKLPKGAARSGLVAAAGGLLLGGTLYGAAAAAFLLCEEKLRELQLL